MNERAGDGPDDESAGGTVRVAHTLESKRYRVLGPISNEKLSLNLYFAEHAFLMFAFSLGAVRRGERREKVFVAVNYAIFSRGTSTSPPRFLAADCLALFSSARSFLIIGRYFITTMRSV